MFHFLIGTINSPVFDETVPTMSDLITSLSSVVTAIFGWVGTIAQTIVQTPLLLITTGFLVLGGAIGIFGRLLSKN